MSDKELQRRMLEIEPFLEIRHVNPDAGRRLLEVHMECPQQE